MNCVNTKAWIIYDKKGKRFLDFTHNEFKNLLLDIPVQLVDKKMLDIKTGKYIWIDGVLNR